jgi:hypothetical protein
MEKSIQSVDRFTIRKIRVSKRGDRVAQGRSYAAQRFEIAIPQRRLEGHRLLEVAANDLIDEVHFGGPKRDVFGPVEPVVFSISPRPRHGIDEVEAQLAPDELVGPLVAPRV